MRIKLGAKLTFTNPVEGVTFSAKEQEEITEIAMGMSHLPNGAITAIRHGVARQILHLEEIGDWVSGDAETERYQQLKWAMMTFEATYTARVAKTVTKA